MLEISPWSVWSYKPGLFKFILIWLTALEDKPIIRVQKPMEAWGSLLLLKNRKEGIALGVAGDYGAGLFVPQAQS